MKKSVRIIISNSTGNERMLINALFSNQISDGLHRDALEEAVLDEILPEDFDSVIGGGKTVVSVIGEMEAKEDGTVNIRYLESEITNMAGVETLISFSDPDEVTFIRTAKPEIEELLSRLISAPKVTVISDSSVRTVLCFNKALERRFCWYNNVNFSTDVSVVTEKFSNTIDGERGGKLDVLYRVEMSAVTTEVSHLTVQVIPL